MQCKINESFDKHDRITVVVPACVKEGIPSLPPAVTVFMPQRLKSIFVPPVSPEPQDVTSRLNALVGTAMVKWEDKFKTLEESNMKLEETNTKLEETNTKLEEANMKLEEANTKLLEANTVLLGHMSALEGENVSLRNCTRDMEEVIRGHDKIMDDIAGWITV
ncbi:hypothetical protein DXG03_009670, partial [Asterophora parasitica]